MKEADVSKDVIEDYNKGYEYGTGKELLKMKRRGDERLYLVRSGLVKTSSILTSYGTLVSDCSSNSH